jgi:hypothetical protein
VPESVESREAKHGSKMIEVKVRFWTNDLAEGKGRIRPKHAWGSGVVRIARNDSHGIEPLAPVIFNSLSEIPMKIEKVLVDHAITIHKSERMKKYMS